MSITVESSLDPDDLMNVGVEDPRKFNCGFCEKTYKYKQLLQTHLNTKHTDNKPLCCEKCSYRTGDPANFRRHVMIHEEPRFACKKCGKLFPRKSNMKRHTSTCKHEAGEKVDIQPSEPLRQFTLPILPSRQLANPYSLEQSHIYEAKIKVEDQPSEPEGQYSLPLPAAYEQNDQYGQEQSDAALNSFVGPFDQLQINPQSLVGQPEGFPCYDGPQLPFETSEPFSDGFWDQGCPQADDCQEPSDIFQETINDNMVAPASNQYDNGLQGMMPTEVQARYVPGRCPVFDACASFPGAPYYLWLNPFNNAWYQWDQDYPPEELICEKLPWEY